MIGSRVALAKANAGASLREVFQAELDQRTADLRKADPKLTIEQARTLVLKDRQGGVLWNMMNGSFGALPFHKAIEAYERFSPGEIRETLRKVFGIVVTPDRSEREIETLEKSERAPRAQAELDQRTADLRKADPKLTIEQARSRILKSDVELYRALESQKGGWSDD